MTPKIFFALILSFCCTIVVQAQTFSVEMQHAVFHLPQALPQQQGVEKEAAKEKNVSYIETYMLIPGSNLSIAQNKEGKWQKKAEIVATVSNDKGVIIHADKYILNGIAKPDSATAATFDLLDQKRVALPEGEFDCEWQIKDLNNSNSNAYISYKKHFGIKKNQQIAFSDIELLNEFEPTQIENEHVKNGFLLKPNILHYYNAKQNSLPFYVELYHSDQLIGNNEPFILQYFVAVSGQNQTFANIARTTRHTAKEVVMLIGELSIEQLYSGNYDLVIQARNRKNEIIASQRIGFQRNKKRDSFDPAALATLNIAETFVSGLDDQAVRLHLNTLLPATKHNEKIYLRNLLATPNTDLMRRYIYNYWIKQSPDNPKLSFEQFEQVAIAVENKYSSKIRHGYETDRGRVFLQYGKPSDAIEVKSEPGLAFPYEIWRYYSLDGKQQNVRFIFYNPQIADNDYILIHSDAFGEINDPYWQQKLYGQQASDIDETRVNQNFGSKVDNADPYFRNTQSQPADGIDD